MKLILIGLSGSGKSTIAKKIKKQLPNFIIYDEDIELEKKLGSIKKIKEQVGQKGFEKIRTQFIREFIENLHNNRDYIISTGGGTGICNDITLYNGINIFLNISLETLTNRLTNDKDIVAQSRRLLYNSDLKQQIDMYNYRLPLYKKYAKYIIDNNIDINYTLNNIITIIQKENNN